MKYYSVYRIENLINGKIYIGCHKTVDLKDGYMGSGKVLKYAQDKYGIENFKKEILAVFDNSEEMFEMESILVNENFVKRDDTYNIKQGGFGGFDYINKHRLSPCWGWEYVNENGLNNSNDNCRKASKKLQKLLDDPEYKKIWLESVRRGVREYMQKNGGGTFTGRKHTELSKRKIGEKTAIAQQGSGNSQFGTCWVFKDVPKKIKKTELASYLDDGWVRGRKKGV